MKNNEIEILIGVPASGKSTYAKNKVSKDSKYVRVNRDDIRMMLKQQDLLDSKLEDMVTNIEYSIVENALSKNKSVIWDNTHLKRKYIDSIVNRFIKLANINFTVFDISEKKAVERDKNREKSVGETIIKKMYKEYKSLMDSYDYTNINKVDRNFDFSEKNTSLEDCVIFDIDGTLAFKGDRGYFDWDKVNRDYLNPTVSEHIFLHKNVKNRKIILLTGRDGSSLELTKKWLEDNEIYFDEIYSRAEGDYRKDTIIKKELYENHIKNKYNVHCVYDDRLQVLDMWYNEGIFTFNVNQGNYIF